MVCYVQIRQHSQFRSTLSSWPQLGRKGRVGLEIRQRDRELAARVPRLLLRGRGFSRAISRYLFFFFFFGRAAGCFHQKFQLHSKVPKELESGRSAGSLANSPLGLFQQNPSLECLSCATLLHRILCSTFSVPSLQEWHVQKCS